MGVRRDLLPDALRPAFARFVRDTYGPRARALGFRQKPGEPSTDTLARPRMLALVGGVGEDAAITTQAQTLARRWLDDPNALGDEVVGAVLSMAARRGDRALFDRYLAAARAATDRRQRSRLLGALGAFEDTVLADLALGHVLSGEFDIRDAAMILGVMTGNLPARERLYRFIKDRFDALAEKMRADELHLVLGIPEAFCDAEHRASAAAFFGPRVERVDNGPRMLARALERIDLCIASDRHHRASTVAFLGKLRRR
jgi:hypothetical protein